ncbi:hypothetical protein BZB76_1704 [Actinomadura pelletieri DSM 43383]|uniref:Uncharacterized protein n=1 Tax=Actinomadura pelletieri DSM 43383 TaxID=1120940 RepID=A0A495QS65_9ACTN|nr:hypothetical protein [Actinomadura pelletieri]RKS76350.1 hypothetical protein BZB76_1704 [Actinomadura pelletieri DSM 43383]
MGLGFGRVRRGAGVLLGVGLVVGAASTGRTVAVSVVVAVTVTVPGAGLGAEARCAESVLAIPAPTAHPTSRHATAMSTIPAAGTRCGSRRGKGG